MKLLSIIILSLVGSLAGANQDCSAPTIDKTSFDPSHLGTVEDIVKAISIAKDSYGISGNGGCNKKYFVQVEPPPYPSAVFRLEENAMGSVIFISKTFVETYSKLGTENEKQVYRHAVAGISGYFFVSGSQRSAAAWARQELMHAMGSSSQLANANRAIVQTLCQESAELCFGLGVYRAVTYPIVANNPDGLRTAQTTHPTISEIRGYLVMTMSPERVNLGIQLTEIARSVGYTEFGRPFESAPLSPTLR